MKVLIQRTEVKKFKDKDGKEHVSTYVVKKIVSKETLKKLKALDMNVDPRYRWVLVHEFKYDEKGKLAEKLTKDHDLKIVDSEKDKLEAENEELKKKVAKLEKGKSKTGDLAESTAKKVDEKLNELESARKMYFEKFNKKPNHLMKVETLLEAIKEDKY